MNKKTFLEIWGDSVKHPIPLDANNGWKLYTKAGENKDSMIKEKAVKLKALDEKDISVIIRQIARNNKEYLDFTISTDDEVIGFLNANKSHDGISEFLSEKDLKRLELNVAGKLEIADTIKDIDTAGMRTILVNNPELLKTLFPDLLESNE